MREKPTHLDGEGRLRMVDVGGKKITRRVARASGWLTLKPETLERIRENNIQKGEVLAVSRVAGIQAAKQTPFLVPLSHPINLTKIQCEFTLFDESPFQEESKKAMSAIRIDSEVRCKDRTGVEIEALTVVEIAALTLYDMCKSIDRGMIIREIQLIHKSGGKSGRWDRRKPHSRRREHI